MEIYYELRKVPFVRLLIPYIAGILLAQFTGFAIQYIIVAIAIITGIAYIIVNRHTGLFILYRFRWLSGVWIYLFLFISGGLTINLHNYSDEKNILPLGDSVEFQGIIHEAPELKNKSVSTVIKLQGYHKGEKHSMLKNKVLAYFPIDSLSAKLAYGDQLLFRSRISEIEGPKNPYAFNYKKYMANHEVYYQTFIQDGNFIKISGNKGSWLKESALHFRSRLLKVFSDNGITGREYAVISALTLGYRDDLDTVTKKAFASSGTIHVLAVSGLHVGIIYLVLNFLLRPFERKKAGRIAKVFIILVILWFYALITGLPASVVRAATMFSFLLIGTSMRRPVNIYNIIAASAFLILLINPHELTDVGFQLSYLAVISIVTIQPWLYRSLVFRSWIFDKIWALFTLSLAAQAGTFPLTLYYFNQFPVYFWLSNMLMIPLVTLILYMAFLLFITSAIPFISFILSRSLIFLLKGANWWASFIEGLPGSTISRININITDIIFIYILIVILSLYLITTRKSLIVMLFAIILAITGNNLYRQIRLKTQSRLVIYHVSHGSAIDFIRGKRHVLFTHGIDISDDTKIDYAVKNNQVRSGLAKESVINMTDIPIMNASGNDSISLFVTNIKGNPYFSFCNKNILVIVNDSLNRFQSDSKLKLDYMIITQDIRLNKQTLETLFMADKIILDGSDSFYTRKYYLSEVGDIIEDVYYTNTDGAVDVDFNLLKNKQYQVRE